MIVPGEGRGDAPPGVGGVGEGVHLWCVCGVEWEGEWMDV